RGDDKPAAKPLPAELAKAIRDGDLKAVRAQLEAGVAVNCRDADGNTPLLLAAVVPGKSAQSPLLEYVSGRVEGMEMPPSPRRDKFAAFTTEEVERVRAWIEQGAVWPRDVVFGPPATEKLR